MLKRTQLIFLTLSLWASAAFASEAVQEFTLDNGLKVVVQPVHRAPVASVQIWYGVGAANEGQGMTGISHMLEHMMFRGTPAYPADTLTQEIGKVGGRQNAFTSYDFTAYHETIPAHSLELALKLEADRMQNLSLLAADFVKEHEVVKEERRMRIEDNPTNKLFEEFQAVANVASPYHHPVIGWMNDIEHYEVAKLKTWYETWYAPNNATLVIVGDINPEEVFSMAKTYFAQIPAKPLPPRPLFTEIENPGKRVHYLELDAKLPALILGFNVPSLKSANKEEDAYALKMIEGILSLGESGRLQKHISRDLSLASNIGANYEIFARGDGVLYVIAVPNPGVPLEALEKAIMGELEQLKNTLITPEEIARFKNQLLANEIYQHDDIENQAVHLGALKTNELPLSLAENLEQKFQNITPDYLQAVAKKYLVDSRLTVSYLNPRKGDATPKNDLLNGTPNVVPGEQNEIQK